MPVKVLIVDDHPVFLAGLRSLLEMNSDMEVIGQANDGQEAVDLQDQLKPDVVVMDINMPGMSGIEATQKILALNPDARVLALSIHSSKRYVKGMLNAGARGYLLKVAVPEELIMAIEKLAMGEMYLSSAITSIALSSEDSSEQKINVLSTKLHRPQITKEHVSRLHLISQLNENMDKPASLISAGAGYGKSTLISSWLEESKTTYAWISLSDEDNDFRNFIAVLSAAVRKSFPKNLFHFNDLVETSVLPSLNILSETLINGLDEIDEEFVLVLDDYHVINNNEINQLLNRLLQFPPQQMHLVISTRRDPYLDLGSLRAHSRINEIRMVDLCFTEHEIINLFENLLDIKLSPEIAQKLYQQTEGWIAGLRLSSLIVKAGEDPNEALNNFNPVSSTTVNYLLKEVISNQPELIQDSLIHLSILDRFCDELVDEICLFQPKNKSTEITGKEVIQTLIHTNLFTISLDANKKWNRFHHLFQELLQRHLKERRSTEEINSYHLKASAWFDRNNLMEEALEHALKANETKMAVDLIAKYRYELINTEQMHRLDRLMNMIPEEIIEETPVLLATKAFYMDFSSMIPEMIEYKEKAKAIVDQLSGNSQEMNAIRGEIELLDGVFYIVFGDWENLIKCSEKALEFLPVQAERFLLNAVGYQVVGYQMLLGVESGMEKVRDLLIKYPIQSNFAQVGEQLWYSLVYAMQGDTKKLKTSGLKLLKLGKKYQFNESVVYGRYFISYAHYMANELDQADPYLKNAVNGSYVHRIHYIVNCAFMLASIYLDRGEVESANNLMEFVIKQTADAGNEVVVLKVKAIQVELAIKEGNIDKALQLNENIDYETIVHRGWLTYIPTLTPIKLKLALNTIKDIEEAQQLLDEFKELNQKTNRKPILIEVLILQAVAFQWQNKREDALLKIEEAINMSSAGNYIHAYIGYGSILLDLLDTLLKTSEHKSHIHNILKAISNKENSLKKSPESELVKDSVPANENDVSELLSYRELEVLVLVAKGLRNKEVSEQLFIQTDTVKKHLKNIFIKLDVPNRLKAVKRAEELGMIDKA